jgi:sarcosine oxidase, subunit beta
MSTTAPSLLGAGRRARKAVGVAVVGGGIAGTSTTYHLARAGVDVTLLEQSDLNTAASGRNAGSLHGQIQFPPMLERGEPWARAFLPALDFLAESLDMWSAMGEELGADLEVSRNGGLMIADTAANMAILERKVALEQSIGLPSRMLDRAELSTVAPYVSKEMVGAALAPVEGKASPLLAAPAFAAAAREHGADVRTNVTVHEVRAAAGSYVLETSQGPVHAEKVVLTANAGLDALTAGLGLRLPISHEPIQASVSEQIAPMIKHLLYFTGDKLTLKQAKAGTLLIGGGWPARRTPEGTHVVDPDSLRANLRVALRVVPSISKVRIIRTWVGVGNGTPDEMPIIGAIPGHDGAFVGMFPYLGFSAGPLLGKTLAGLALGQSPSRDLSAFNPTRF